LLAYVGIETFVYGGQNTSLQLLAAVSSILIVTFSGLFDDLNVKSRTIKTKDGKNVKVGFPQWLKPLLTLPAAIPLMVISAGETSMLIPLIGKVNFGVLYPLLLIPIGVVGMSNAVNLLGGFNGAEAGMGLVYMSSLGLYSLLYNLDPIGSVIFLVSAASLLAFLRYNWFPAKILPGDSLTYLLGALAIAGIVLGNIERAGIIAMTPFLIEFLLKARKKFKASCLGVVGEDEKIRSKYDGKIYSLTHIIMKFGNFTERQMTAILMLVELFFCFIIFLKPF
jgi:UDP-N-acetylglucosamine--dolichyl-phosphate N-acetylglucosaminephosphotransferase